MRENSSIAILRTALNGALPAAGPGVQTMAAADAAVQEAASAAAAGRPGGFFGWSWIVPGLWFRRWTTVARGHTPIFVRRASLAPSPATTIFVTSIRRHLLDPIALTTCARQAQLRRHLSASASTSRMPRIRKHEEIQHACSIGCSADSRRPWPPHSCSALAPVAGELAAAAVVGCRCFRRWPVNRRPRRRRPARAG